MSSLPHHPKGDEDVVDYCVKCNVTLLQYKIYQLISCDISLLRSLVQARGTGNLELTIHPLVVTYDTTTAAFKKLIHSFSTLKFVYSKQDQIRPITARIAKKVSAIPPYQYKSHQKYRCRPLAPLHY